MLVGGGGGRTREMRRDDRGPFSRSEYGFAHLNITNEKVIVKYIGRDGKALHSFERTRDGTVTVRDTTGTDQPTTHQLRTIQGIDPNKQSTTAPAGD